VDATVEQDLAKKYGVRGYPTIKFFNNGTAIEYNGGRSQNEIIAWLQKRTGPPAKEINTVDELNALKESDDVVVIGAFKVIDLFFLNLF
jgi:protein disulfide-isomerase A1